MALGDRATGDKAVGRTAPGPAAPSDGPGLLALNLKYFAIRAALFGAALAVVMVLGVDGLLAFAIALVASGLASYPLAVRQRKAVLARVEARRAGRSR